MTRRGRTPKLPEIKRLESAIPKSVIDDNIFKASSEPFIPDHINEDAQACIELIKQSMPPAVYASLDTYLLTAFGVAWAWHKRASFEISAPTFQPLVKGSTGQETVNPWFKILNQQASMLVSLGDRLGLNPTARLSLQITSSNQPKTVSKFDGLLGKQETKSQ